MPSAIRLTSAALLTVVLGTAYTALVKQPEWNGTWTLEQILTNPIPTLPNTNIPITLPKTGFRAVDSYFAFMTSFFYTTLDSKNIQAHVAGNHLLGSLTSIWLIMLAEAHNSSPGFLFATYIIEFLGELLGIGIFTPIWTILHLFWTSTPSEGLPRPINTKALGWAVLIGHAVPTELMLLTKPDGEGIASQQFWIVARLFHPVFVYVAWAVLKNFVGRQSSSPSALFGRRKFFVFSMLISGFFHVTSLSWLLAEQMAPGWFKDEISAALSSGNIVIPGPFWSADVVGKVTWEDGVAIFLQWDYLCSASAILIWAVGLFAEVEALGSSLETYGQTVLVTILAGPAAGAAYLLMERNATLAARATMNRRKAL